MSVIETAKQLLQKGIALNDEELINMANQLLSTEVVSQPEEVEDVSKAPEPQTNDEQPKSKFEDFTAPTKKTDQTQKTRFARTEPISAKNRENKFVDDGVEHSDVTTPDTPRTVRNRKAFSKISQVCKKCNATFETHPAHKRDWFVCSDCIRR